MTAPATLTHEELDRIKDAQEAAARFYSSEANEAWAGAEYERLLREHGPALVSMVRRTVEAEEKLAAFETGIVPTQWFDDERVRAERAETTNAQLRKQMATLRTAVEILLDLAQTYGPGETIAETVGRAALAATAPEPREGGRASQTVSDLCEDCPPVDYPTDKTRCDPCPWRQLGAVAPREGER